MVAEARSLHQTALEFRNYLYVFIFRCPLCISPCVSPDYPSLYCAYLCIVHHPSLGSKCFKPSQVSSQETFPLAVLSWTPCSMPDRPRNDALSDDEILQESDEED